MPETDTAHLEIKAEGAVSRLLFQGRLDAAGVALVWDRALHAVKDGVRSVVDLSGVQFCDSAGIALLLALRRAGAERIENASEKVEALLQPFDGVAIPADFHNQRKPPGPLTYAGQVALRMIEDVRQLITFTGKLLVLLTQVLRKPSVVRWREVWITLEKVGNNALVIVLLIGFLMGFIMGFQSAMPLREFGVDIFVVNLVALAMLRELGPIMTAIVLAGRSGSAFAAEIGTMKINEEVNALLTMGLDPDRFLVVPRVIAALIATPVLTIFANAVGILGGISVVLSLGYPWAAVMNQLHSAVTPSDVISGMIKAVVFGLLVASVGCLRGLQTKNGALAVGESTTRAVVSGIFLIILTDALFAVAFYILDF